MSRPPAPEPPTPTAAPVGSAGLAAATRWMVLGRLVAQVSRFAVSVLLARLLSPEAFGLIAVAMTTILALDVLKDLGTGAAIIQRKEVDQTLLSSVFHLNAAIGIVCTAAMVLGAPFIAALFDAPEATPVVQALSLVVLVQGFTQTHHAMLRRSMRFRGIAAVEITGALTTGVVSIGLALAGLGVWAMVWGTAIGTTAGCAVAWARSGWSPSLRFSARRLRGIAGFSLNTAAFNATTFVLQNTDKLLVGRWLGAGQLGVYSLAQRTISYPVESIGQVLMTVLFPAFARVQDDDDALRRGYTRATGAIAFVTLPLMVGAAVVAEPLVEAVLGAQWRPLIPVLWFMAPAGAIAALLSAVNTLYSAKGRADWMFRWGLASGVVTLGAFALGLQWGLVGLAIAYLTVMLVQAPIGFAIAISLIGLRLRTFLAALAPYLLLTTAMAVAAAAAVLGTKALGAAPWVQLVGGVGMGGATYLGLALAARPPAMRDVLTLVGRGRS